MIQLIAKGSQPGVVSSNRALAVVPPQDGIIVLNNVTFFADAAGNYRVFRPKHRTTANAAVSSSSALVVKTDSAGKVGGSVIATADSALIFRASDQVWLLIGINAVAAVNGSTVSLTLASVISCAAGDNVYVCRAGDLLSRATGADEIANNMPNQGVSFDRMPLAVEIAATGNNTLSLGYDVMR